ncbi:hypothetical protein [Pseudobacillus wudalianchiensis]|uniref:Uncharacterized protein n=1 Tax=Pseudobacillus wudalianchiensis TaxID=1743143 RepID=A0A1B9AZ64_9BACI|nr:hypothetical protein [Bacillus wudalianchiensis]OCA89071.1 hypothetical protein A8F95_06590 [Bacillus wudalianchiensis]
MNWFTIGSLTIPAAQLAVLAAFVITALVLWLKKERYILDIYVNAIFLFVAVWKASVLLFSFAIVKQAPLSILYFNGGWKGIWLGLIAVGIYVVRRCRKEKQAQAVWTWMVVITFFELAVSLLTGQAGLLAFIQSGGSIVLLAIPLGQVSKTIWLFTLWQLLFESLTAELFSNSSLLYIGAMLFFTLIIRRNPSE